MATLKAGPRKRIHVNGQVIRQNKRDATGKPGFTVKTYNANHYGRVVTIHGPSQLVQDFNNRLASGAVAWIETRAAVDVEL